jgi:hypothetical protein
MTKRPQKKIGRPATGRDPAYSFRLPKSLIDRVAKAAKDMGRSQSEVVREALHLGLVVLHGERPERGWYLPPDLRPSHDAEFHEAGHAVATWIVAKLNDEDPYDVVDHIKLKPGGAGHVLHIGGRKMEIHVAGAVAQAKAEGRTFEEVWDSRGCSSDRRKAKRLLSWCAAEQTACPTVEQAAHTVTEWFSDPGVWRALTILAKRLPNTGKMNGAEARRIYGDAIAGYPGQRWSSSLA